MKRSSVRLFVCLSHRLTATAASGKFAAERRVGRKYRLTAAGAAQSNGLAVRRAGAPPLFGPGAARRGTCQR